MNARCTIFFIFFLCITPMNFTHTMQADLENELGTLQRDLTTLTDRLQPTPIRQSSCQTRGTCRKFSRRGKWKGGTWKKGHRHHRFRIPEEREHAIIRHQFRKLQRKAGIQKSPRPRQRKISSNLKQGSQPQFNAVRSALNALLAKDTLSEADKKEINQKINELAALNPARWPRPEDYRELLNKKK